MARATDLATVTPDLSTPHLDRLVDDGHLLGYSVAVRSGDGSTRVATRGVTDPDGGRAVDPSTSYRLASLSKPVAGLLAAGLLAEGVLAPEDPIRRWVPELDGVRVLLGPCGPARGDRAARASGHGPRPADDDERPRHPLRRHAARARHGGGRRPPGAGAADARGRAFLARLGELPLAFQPGGGWAYHTSTDVLSVVLARASGVPLDRLLAERLTGPLDAPSLSFSTPDPAVPGTVVPRPGRGLGADRARRTRGPRHAHAVVRPLGHRHGHRPGPRRARPSHCPPGRRGRGRADPGADGGPGGGGTSVRPQGYSFGHQVSVATADDPQGPRAGSAGWSGGTGTLGIADPAADRTVVLLTNRGLDGPLGTAAFDAALADLWSDVRDG